MLSKRIIPCLDIKDGRTVKGVNFVSLKDAGDPVALARRYSEMGADELVLLDITATHEGRKTFADVVTRVAEEVNIPFTVGGGISTVEDVERMLSAGADKVSINSSALKNPSLINDITRHFGSQVCVVAIDGRDGIAYTHGGRVSTGRNIMDWAKECADRGAGEILYTSMNHDGTKQGFDNERLRLMSEQLPIPVIASGGAGSMQHFADAFLIGKADAALAASVFHYGEIAIPELKKFLINDNIPIRL